MAKDQGPGLPREKTDNNGLDGAVFGPQWVGHLDDVTRFQRDLLEVSLRHGALHDGSDDVGEDFISYQE